MTPVFGQETEAQDVTCSGATTSLWQARAKDLFYSKITLLCSFELRRFLFNKIQTTESKVSWHTYTGLQGETSTPTPDPGPSLSTQEADPLLWTRKQMNLVLPSQDETGGSRSKGWN